MRRAALFGLAAGIAGLAGALVARRAARRANESITDGKTERKRSWPAGQELVKSAMVGVGGLRVHYLQAGNAGSPVLLLHGGGLDSASLSYRFTIGPLAQNHRVYAPDWPGFGESEPPVPAWEFECYVEFLGRLLDALELERASLVGLSLGGAIALGHTLRSPERVEKLVLVDSYGLGRDVPGGIAGYLFTQSPLNELTWALLRRSRGLVRASLRGLVHDPRVVTEDLVDEVYEMLQRPGVSQTWLAITRHEVGWRGLRTSFLHRLCDVAAPTLIVHGAEDQLVPVDWARQACSLIPDCQLEILEACGHWAPRERPEAFNQAVGSFLTGRTS